MKTIIQLIKEAREEIAGDRNNSYLLFNFICGLFGLIILVSGMLSGKVWMIIVGACGMASPVLLPILFVIVIALTYIVFMCVTFPVIAIIELMKYIGVKRNSRKKE